METYLSIKEGFQIMFVSDWREVSVVKSSGCFCREPGFGSQHPQPPLTPASSGLSGHSTDMHTGRSHTHKKHVCFLPVFSLTTQPGHSRSPLWACGPTWQLTIPRISILSDSPMSASPRNPLVFSKTSSPAKFTLERHTTEPQKLSMKS